MKRKIGNKTQHKTENRTKFKNYIGPSKKKKNKYLIIIPCLRKSSESGISLFLFSRLYMYYYGTPCISSQHSNTVICLFKVLISFCIMFTLKMIFIIVVSTNWTGTINVLHTATAFTVVTHIRNNWSTEYYLDSNRAMPSSQKLCPTKNVWRGP